MSDPSKEQAPTKEGGFDFVMFALVVICVGLMVVFWNQEQMLSFLIAETVLISIVLWQACDPFAESAQWVGSTYRLPGSVRGATLDAIASSLPELFTGIFFVVVMASQSTDSASMAAAVGEGYGATIATCAGSAIYNMILIPGVCALVIAYRRVHRPVIDVERDVVWRDGLFFLACEAVLLVFLFQATIQWWMGALFVAMYFLYIVKLQHDASTYRRYFDVVTEELCQIPEDQRDKTRNRDLVLSLRQKGTRVTRATVARIRHASFQGTGGAASEGDDDTPTHARVFFRTLRVPLNALTAWLLIGWATAVAAVACYFLVEAVYHTAELLKVPPFFVAVILAAAASSLPDMFLSIGASKRGDDSGAISNAFGSNIFDICICLSVPLLLASYLNGWQPISLLQDGKPMAGLVGLRMLLWGLTLATLFIIWQKRQIGRGRGLVLCSLYCVFIAYAVLGSLDYEICGYKL